MYTPVWTRPDSPTASLNNTDMLKYYKSRDVADSCAFSLRAGGRHLPEHVLHAYEALAEAVFVSRKETPAHRRELARVRSLWRTWADQQAQIARLWDAYAEENQAVAS